MISILLAAGSGTRLGELTKNTPKSFIKINGISLIERQIQLLRKFNIHDIVVVTGPNQDKFNLENITLINDKEHLTHDQLGSLMAAKSFFNNELMIFYTDIIFDEQILSDMVMSKGEITIAIDMDWQKSYDERLDNPILDAGRVLVSNNKVKQLSENIPIEENSKNLGEFLGIVKLSKNISSIFLQRFSYLLSNHNGNFHDADSFKMAKLMDMLQDLLDVGVEITPVVVKDNWCEIDTEMDLLRAKKIFS